MYVIKLPNGNLLVPESALEAGGVVGDAYVEITPADPEYRRLAPGAVTQAELDQRRRRWQEGDEALRQEFEEFLAARAGQDRQAGDGRSGS
jgi:ABC-type transporter Mla subunit MlaD